jgi:glycosyltransferase involved in cell wall biosynthesis
LTKKKKKIVWICSFSDIETQKQIKPFKKNREHSTWIARTAKLFEDNKDYDIYIISPHEYLPQKKQFSQKNIHYCFFNPFIPLSGRHWPGFFRMDRWTNYYLNKRIIKKYVNKIKPDLIHLHGAEQAQYSSSILQFKHKYPILVTIQGFIFDRLKNNKTIEKRIETENNILKSFKNYGYRTKKMGEVMKFFNPNANLFWHHYPVSEIKLYQTEKKYDIVFFARITIEKGIEDLLKATSIIKKKKKDISLLVVGPSSPMYLDKLFKLSTKLGIANNIDWAGFQETQEELHQLVQQAKISVLPTYFDIISGTIIESLFLKLAVVAYNVGSIHELNENKECIKLVEKGKVEELANIIISLLNDNAKTAVLANNGFQCAKEMFDNTKIVEDLSNIYNNIISKGI